jgi:hypothetical protein
MKKIYILIALLFIPCAQAQDFDYEYDEEEPKFEASVDSKTYPAKDFKVKGVKVKTLPPIKPSKAALPELTTREAAFREVKGLDEAIKGLDTLDRDILYVNGRTKTFADLKKTYPQVSESVLKRLHERLRKP